MPATFDAIRAAILTAEMRDRKGRLKDYVAEIFITATDGRVLQAIRWKKGWTLQHSNDGRVIDRIAARHGSKYDRPSAKTFLGRMLAGREFFNWPEIEDVAKQFLSSPGRPASVSWVGKDKG